MFESHKKIERNVFWLLVFAFIAISIGGMTEILPLFKREVSIEKVEGMRSYTPLELSGFLIYKREGCYGCHSQQIRTLRDEVERYGHYSLAAESMYDYPFMWGSKRTGPDLARVGGKYSDDWQVEHLINPRSLVPESIMPPYPFLAATPLDTMYLKRRMEIHKMTGVPYSDEDLQQVASDIKVQLGQTTDPALLESFQKRYPGAVVRKFYKQTEEVTELDALIAYLQSLGNKVDLKTNQGRDW